MFMTHVKSSVLNVKETVEAFMFFEVSKLGNTENSPKSFIICGVKFYI